MCAACSAARETTTTTTERRSDEEMQRLPPFLSWKMQMQLQQSWTHNISSLHLKTRFGAGDLASAQSLSLHTFSAFWLRSSVVSVLISLISNTESTALHDIKLIFDRGPVTRCACTTAQTPVAPVLHCIRERQTHILSPNSPSCLFLLHSLSLCRGWWPRRFAVHLLARTVTSCCCCSAAAVEIIDPVLDCCCRQSVLELPHQCLITNTPLG